MNQSSTIDFAVSNNLDPVEAMVLPSVLDKFAAVAETTRSAIIWDAVCNKAFREGLLGVVREIATRPDVIELYAKSSQTQAA